jgi:hypothetical protein
MPRGKGLLTPFFPSPFNRVKTGLPSPGGVSYPCVCLASSGRAQIMCHSTMLDLETEVVCKPPNYATIQYGDRRDKTARYTYLSTEVRE